MKKTTVKIGIMLVVFAMIMTACSPSGSTPASTSKGVIYYLAPELSDEFQVGVNKMMLADGTQMGYTVRELNGGNIASTQVNQMDDAINQKPLAIILAAVDASSITGEVQKARAAGIPVLVFDRFIQDTPVDFSSVVGTIKIGQLGAAEVVKALKQKFGTEKGTVFELMGDAGDNYSVLIDQGFMEIMKQYPNIDVSSKATPQYDPATSASIVDDQLTAKNNNIDAIFVIADFRIPAIDTVIQAHGIKTGQITIIGTDGSPTGLQSIRDGWCLETVGVPMNQQVYGIWQYIGDVLAKKTIQAASAVDVQGVTAELKIETWGPTLYLPGQIVDKSNVDDPNNWGNMKVEATPTP
jgi:ribose transport system substrate-binding protein